MNIPPRSLIIPMAVVLVILALGRAHAAEQPIRLVVVLTCSDVRDLVAWKGWAEMESHARAAGTSEAQIAEARRCLAK